ncbi:MAG: protein kinase [Anaerolineales bacterium]
MSFAPGENVGPYRIIEQLGQGGMASVFKAYHAALDRYVALKVLHPAFLEDPQFLARFQREARVVAKLEHPNIVPVYDFAEHSGQPYLVMKFIEGITLKARLAQGPLTKKEATDIIQSVGAALSYAHQRGVLHRDIKPSNVLIDPEGSVYLADFGLARMAEAGASTLSGDVMLGTPHYISPEQAKGVQQLNECTDIYSLGVVLYELVVGRVPFNADTPFSIIHDHIYSPLPLPSEVNPAVPASIQRVLLKALAKDPQDRYQSVRDLTSSFVAALTGINSEADDSVTIPQLIPTMPGTEPAPTKDSQPELESGSRQVIRDTSSQPISSSQQKQESSRGRWMWIVGGVAISGFCLLAFLGAIGDEANNNRPSDEPVATQVDNPPVEEENVDILMRNAEANAQAGRNLLAFQGFVRAANLMMEANDFPGAAQAFVRAVEVAEPAGEDIGRIEGPAVQALFMIAGEDGIWEILDRLDRVIPEWPVIPLMRARAHVVRGELEQAEGYLEPMRQNPDMAGEPLFIAVEVEILLQRGEIDPARQLVGDVMQNRDMALWLREYFQQIKDDLQTQP